jgi:kynurenine formamidase
MREGALHVSSLRKDSTASRRQVAIDVVAMHTHDFTHVDALAHVGYEDQLYNGVPADSVGYQGATRNSIDSLGAIVGRAVLLDVARARGVDALRSGHAISRDDLEDVIKRQGVAVQRGDILLIRTGWVVPYLQDRSIALSGWPGLGASTVEWLAEHEVCAVGADNVAVEVMPFEDPNRSFIVHERFIRDLGGYLIEFLDLESLAHDEVYESLFVMAPLRLVGGLGSPVTPIAIA